MASITAYVLDDDGALKSIRTGDVDSVLLAIDIEQKQYTLTPPPNDEHLWRWVDNKWITDETS